MTDNNRRCKKGFEMISFILFQEKKLLFLTEKTNEEKNIEKRTMRIRY